ncbi:hypothetical protein TSUD_114890 [Trifolium subterraneum]|uniref:Peptidase C14 caspase domain-containing protein n=1 Tax=Trifolium subterraneum TaxID=3900 RepID=A0A2Z6NPM8_TRISU|nr:hypothetical protein TSUD_114890 [Trifolium subterraneum]
MASKHSRSRKCNFRLFKRTRSRKRKSRLFKRTRSRKRKFDDIGEVAFGSHCSIGHRDVAFGSPGSFGVAIASGNSSFENPRSVASRNNRYFLAGDSTQITAEFFRGELEALPIGCEFILILDCCSAGAFNIGHRGIVLAACEWNQFAKEIPTGIKENRGLFTHCLVKTMKKNCNKNLTYDQMFDKVAKRVEKLHFDAGFEDPLFAVVWDTDDGTMDAVLEQDIDQIFLGYDVQLPIMLAFGGWENAPFLGGALGGSL